MSGQLWCVFPLFEMEATPEPVIAPEDFAFFGRTEICRTMREYCELRSRIVFSQPTPFRFRIHVVVVVATGGKLVNLVVRDRDPFAHPLGEILEKRSADSRGQRAYLQRVEPAGTAPNVKKSNSSVSGKKRHLR